MIYCENCPWFSLCKKGYVIDCFTGEVYESPSFDDSNKTFVPVIKTYDGEE